MPFQERISARVLRVANRCRRESPFPALPQKTPGVCVWGGPGSLRTALKHVEITQYGLFFRFFGTNGHPVAAVEFSLSDVATNFRSAIDLWRSQGRFIGLNEENENFLKIQLLKKKKYFS